MQLTALARRLLGDVRGASALEFALIAPLMILLYFGLAELTLALMAERRASHAASAIADLVAQDTQTSPADLDDVFTASRAILSPFQATTLQMRVTSVLADAEGSPEVAWSRGYGAMAALAQGAPVPDFPADLLQPNESVIMAQVEYEHTSPVQQVLPHPIVFKEVFYLRPRRTDQVLCSGC